MDSGLIFLFAGQTVVWLVIGGYVLYINRRVRELRDELDQLSDESLTDDPSS